MPQHKSCEKRIRQSKKENLRNKMARSRMRTALKKVYSLNKKDEATQAMKEAVSVLDKNVKFRVIHKNNAANKKSRLVHYVTKLSS
ncbi:MAG: 30S ribosomal protein S20 [Chitinivibrionales bacterium]|nr:30S ribosomal protein S20 [Chitinivibrionales bacterium]